MVSRVDMEEPQQKPKYNNYDRPKPIAQVSSLLPHSIATTHKVSLRITRRRLPHWEIDGAIYFATFNTWEKLELNESARKTVLESCLFFNGQRYNTFAVVVMSDHVHWLLQPLPKPTGDCWALREIMHSIKSYSAKQIPRVMKHIGIVWQIEWHDRIIRDEPEFQNTWEYIRQNPFKAGLSDTPNTYPFLWEINIPSTDPTNPS
jgi:putative transposase